MEKVVNKMWISLKEKGLIDIMGIRVRGMKEKRLSKFMAGRSEECGDI